MTQRAIVNTAYLAPVQYYSKFFQYDEIYIEQFDSYSKQTYRNRCQILGANGPLNLTIPVVKESGKKIRTKDIRIDYATEWQKNHWRSIFSAYNSSPFFEFFADDFAPLFDKKETFLIDFNHKLHQIISDHIEPDKEPKYTSTFNKDFKGDDYRNIISPKKSFQQYDPSFQPVVYTQTFDEKFDFTPNLSIIDLLFNKGPESEEILIKQIVRL
ncbi:MAG TPA: WbqC family protein [Prolixibacteraceae bacterium]|nr:WbqC family protein [Prolixibacteraceae bacterium]